LDWRQRLYDRMSVIGINDAELCRLAGVNASTMRDVRAGRVPRVDRAMKIAAAVGYSLGELYEGTDRDVRSLIVVGSTGAGEVFSEQAGLVRHLEVDLMQPNTVFIDVTGDDLLPSFRRGDVIGGVRFSGSHLDNLIGLECLLAEHAGPGRWVKVLARGSKPGRFNLRSIKPGLPDVENIKLDWAAPIKWVIRGN